MGKQIDIAKEFGFDEGPLPRSSATLILERHTSIKAQAITVRRRESDFMGNMFSNEDLIFELTVTDNDLRHIDDHMARHVETGQKILLQLILEENDLPLLFKDCYIASIQRSTFNCTTKITVISAYDFEENDAELIKRRERNQPSLKRFRIISEED